MDCDICDWVGIFPPRTELIVRPEIASMKAEEAVPPKEKRGKKEKSRFGKSFRVREPQMNLERRRLERVFQNQS